MKNILTLIFILGAFAGKSQITITGSDMPTLNDTIRFSTSKTNVSAMVSQTGSDQVWDFSSLAPDFQNLAAFKSASAINPAYLLTFSAANYGTKAPDLQIGSLSGTDVYNFYKFRASSYTSIGRGVSFNGVPLSQVYNDSIYHFPLNFNDVDSNAYTSNEVNAVVATLKTSAKRVNTVDGWGDLITPFGTFQCLRVKSVINSIDSVKISGFPVAIGLARKTTELKWLATGEKIPVLEITVVQTQAGGSQTSIRYIDRNRPELFMGLADFSANKTTFVSNTKDTCILTDKSARNPVSRKWAISPTTFMNADTSNNTSPAYKIFFTAPGTYTVKLTVRYDAGADDTVITNYITVSAPPMAAFASNKQNIYPTDTVDFTDSSTGNPIKWQWSFIPDKVVYMSGTNASSQNPQVRFTQAGVYDVTLTVHYAIDSSTVTRNNYISCLNTGIEETRNYIWSVFPNPSNEKVIIAVNQQKIASINVYDLTGKQVKIHYLSENDYTGSIDVSGLDNGLYFVKIQLDNEEVNGCRIMVQK